MSEQYSHLTGGPAVPPPPSRGREEPAAPPKRKRFGRKVAFIALTGAAAAITVAVISGQSGSTATASSPAAHSASADPRPAPSGYNTVKPPASNPFGDNDPSNDPNYQPDGGGNNWNVDPAPKPPTVAQEQALESAESYLDMGGFSRAGLIDQLHSSAGEGFRMADARWAVNHTHANWNHQAVLSAKSYLDMGGFSRASLIDQLSSPYGEQFTVAQATYAANQVGL